MNVLFDTQLVLWIVLNSPSLPARARTLLTAPETSPWISAASLWEVAIKTALRRPGFEFDPRIMRRQLLGEGWSELIVNGDHAAEAAGLPLIHKDPFDRMLIAQASHEGFTLVTADVIIARYAGRIERV